MQKGAGAQLLVSHVTHYRLHNHVQIELCALGTTGGVRTGFPWNFLSSKWRIIFHLICFASRMSYLALTSQ